MYLAAYSITCKRVAGALWLSQLKEKAHFASWHPDIEAEGIKG